MRNQRNENSFDRSDQFDRFGDDGRDRSGRGRRGGRHPGTGRRGRGEASRGEPGRRRGGRARRGDVRAAVVALLAERPMHGYEIIQELDERTNGAWRPSPGSVYPTLSLLEDEGLVTATEEDGKRRFTLTDAGTEALEANKARSGDRSPWDQITDGISNEDLSLRKLVSQVGVAVRQVAETGNQEAKAKAVEVMTDTRKRLYAILAETD